MSSDHFTQIAGLEPTYSAREAAALLGRSYSWLDQGVRKDQFVLRDGTTVQPLRSPGGYRYFSVEMLRDIAAYLWTRDLGDGRAEVLTVSWWESRAAIIGFAGSDIEAAVFYPEDDEYLVDRETTVSHFEVAAAQAG
jgi:hypothetical protein